MQRIRPDPSRWSFGEDARNLAAEADLGPLGFRRGGNEMPATRVQKRRKIPSIIADVVEERLGAECFDGEYYGFNFGPIGRLPGLTPTCSLIRTREIRVTWLVLHYFIVLERRCQ